MALFGCDFDDGPERALRLDDGVVLSAGDLSQDVQVLICYQKMTEKQQQRRTTFSFLLSSVLHTIIKSSATRSNLTKDVSFSNIAHALLFSTKLRSFWWLNFVPMSKTKQNRALNK